MPLHYRTLTYLPTNIVGDLHNLGTNSVVLETPRWVGY